MKDIWLIADLHLGHQKLIDGWEVEPGSRKGPRGERFASLFEMTEAIYDNWARVVKPQDKIYVLGDIAWKTKFLDDLRILPGHKRAVLGNHDKGRSREYAEVFEKVYGAHCLEPGFVLTHIPVHPSTLSRQKMRVNIHGHLHDEVVSEKARKERWLIGEEDPIYVFVDQPDPRYVCVSCEQVDYTPIHIDEITARVKDLFV